MRKRSIISKVKKVILKKACGLRFKSKLTRAACVVGADIALLIALKKKI